MADPAKAVFLSYASQDTEAAGRICDALRAAGINVWFDQSALRGGEAWDASIRRQIKECALFVPIISANTQAREEGYFRREWNLAAMRTLDMADDRAFLLPVVIDPTLDASARVPERFRDVQWTHLPAGETPAAFTERVRRLLSGDAPQIVTPLPPRAAGTTTPPIGPAAHEAPSIAVLPFVNMSRDEENEYFADGLAEEILNVLAKIPGVRVAARSSAFAFKGKAAGVAEVGRALNVAAVLEGSVRKAGNRLRISVQLAKVSDGYHLWSEVYDRMLEDIFAVQDDIAQSVVKELRTTLLGETPDAKAGKDATAAVAAAVKGRSTDPEAYRLFLQARHFIDRNTREDTANGIGYLKEALALDPGFALAWAELGRAYSSEGNWGWARSAEGYERARDAILRALALEPDLAEAHAGMAWVQTAYDWDWPAAAASFRRAVELAPGNALVLHQAGLFEASMGRFDEGIELTRRAVEQDPLSAAAYFFLGLEFALAERFAEALAALNKSVELGPQRAVTRGWVAVVLLFLGRSDEALTEAKREPEEWARHFALALIHHGTGRQAESEQELRELIRTNASDAAYQIAEVHAVHGAADAAFEWLERAYVQKDAGIPWTKVDPFLRSLRADPRWSVFLRKTGFAG